MYKLLKLFIYGYLFPRVYAKLSATPTGKKNLRGLGLAKAKILVDKKMDTARLLFKQEKATKK